MCVICTDIYIIMVCNCHEKVRPKWASYFVRVIALNHWFVLLYSCISLPLCPWISLLWALAVASAAMLRRLLPLSRLIWLSIHILVHCIWSLHYAWLCIVCLICFVVLLYLIALVPLDLIALGIGSCLSSATEEAAATLQFISIVWLIGFVVLLYLIALVPFGSHCSGHWQLPQQRHWGGCCHSPVHKHCMINWFCCTLISHCPCALWISLLWALAVASAAPLRRLLPLSSS